MRRFLVFLLFFLTSPLWGQKTRLLPDPSSLSSISRPKGCVDGEYGARLCQEVTLTFRAVKTYSSPFPERVTVIYRSLDEEWKGVVVYQPLLCREERPGSMRWRCKGVSWRLAEETR